MGMNASQFRVARSVVSAVIGLSALTTSQAEVRYEVVDLGTALFESLSDAVPVISNTGLVAGTDTFPTSRAYLWDSGQVLSIEPVRAGASTRGYGVNDHGAVVGVTPGPTATDLINRPFIYQQGVYTFIPDVEKTNNINARAGYAINNAGVVVGEWEARPFIYADGVSRYLEGSVDAQGKLATAGVAKDISNNGWAVGTMTYHGRTGAVIWHDGVSLDIGSLPVAAGQRTDASAAAINDLGQVVGWSNSVNGRRAILWSDGEMIDLGSLRGAGRTSEALDISNRGEVVGVSECIGAGCAFVWNRDEGMLQLQDYIDPDSDWILNKATSINDAGWIVGNGFRRSTGLSADFLLIPVVPEPAAWGLLLCGMWVVAVARRVRLFRTRSE